ncbi:MAG: tetratricopeptide repeat protein [Planctomycetes bacterium]|nr:tetratricopeptide repeat protein [Planctomycetota bacterium]
MSRLLAPFVALALFLLPLFAQDDVAPRRVEPEAVPAAVRVALMRGDYDTALAELARCEAETPATAAFWAWLRGSALALAERDAEAERALARLDGPLAGSRWQAKARYLRAEVLRRLGRYAEAEAIYEAGAESVRAEPRQRELAEIYLGFADALSTVPATPGPTDELDYGRAYALYEKVLELDAPRDLVDRAMLRRADCQALSGCSGAAVELYRAYLAEFDASDPGSKAARAGAGAAVLEARLALGRALLATGDRDAARREFEDVGATLADVRAQRGGWGTTVGAWDAARQQRADELAGDAAYAVASTWQWQDADEAAMAVAALQRFLATYLDHPQATQARFDIGQVNYQAGRAEEALAAFREFRTRPLPAKRVEDELRLRLVQRALYLEGVILAGQGRFEQAIEAYRSYTQQFASGPDWSDAQRGIVEAQYQRCEALRQERRWTEARAGLAAFLQDHPLDPRADAVNLEIGELFREEGQALREDSARAAEAAAKFREAVAHWRGVVSKHPGSDVASAALFDQGEVLAKELGELTAAFEAYRQCDFGAWSVAARQALLDMVEPELGLRTERTWRDDEPAQVVAWVRNVEKLEVELYALDLEAYFRKHLTHGAIEELDLDLITPDQRFEVAVDGYERFRGLEQRITLPVEGPGVWAVVVSSEERRATTLVIRSDVDVVVKSSRREVFVYAQDMRRGAPAADVDVLVALPAANGGAPTFHETRTGDDGVARLALPELGDEDQVRLFAVRGGDVASTGLSLSGLGLRADPQPRGFVYTDRPAYRRGQAVGWRALVRSMQPGRAGFTPGERYRYEVRDARGRVVDGGQVALSAYGSASGALQLDPLAPLGDYTVHLLDREGRGFQGAFEVRDFELQRVELSLELDQEVYFRGETVQLTAKAAYYFGEPLADSPLRIALPDGRQVDLRTDDDGVATLSFETRDLPSERLLAFQGTLTEEQVSTVARAHLAVRGFSASVSTERDLVLAGDSFDVHVRTVGPDREGVARALALRVLHREERPGTTLDVLAEEHELTTDAHGDGHLALSLERGGWYTLRVEGTDRFGNPVLAQRTLFVSGDEDETKLRVLVESERVKVGEEVVLDVHDRAGAGLALVTVESEEVLEYRLVQLQPGHNRVTLTTGDEHYPNVHVSAALMLANRFWRAGADLTLERELKVAVEPVRETYAPGEEAEVRLTVTDALGRPVRAELSLAVVDEALFELFPDRLPDVARFFAAERRKFAAMNTESSCGFSYQGVVSEVAAAVLEQRLEERARTQIAARRGATLGALFELDKAPVLKDAQVLTAYDALDFDLEALEEPLEGLAWNEAIGLGGGAGGKFGGRFGGKRNLRAAGGVAAALTEDAAFESDAAFWTPAVVTGEDGRATVRFVLPERSTRWHLKAVGADDGVQTGQSEASFVSRAELFLELELPPVLVEGDALRVGVRVHGEGVTGLNLTTGGAGTHARQQFKVSDGDVREHEFALVGPVEAGELEVLVTANAPGRPGASARKTIRVRPWGLEEHDVASGVLEREAAATLRLPQGGEYRGVRLELALDRDLNRMLARVALGGDVRRALDGDLLAATAHELGGALAVLEMYRVNGHQADPEVAALRRSAEGSLGRLLAAQSERGGWRLCGGATSDEEHTETTCAALVALVRARAAGLVVPDAATDLARAFLGERFRAAGHEDDELKAMIVHALACAGQDDFSTANRLHRERASLSTAALAYTARALVEMERASMAAEVVAELAKRETSGELETRSNRSWDRSSDATAALALLAALEAAPDAPWIERAANALEQRAPWHGGRARGLALEALAKKGGTWAAANDASRVQVLVDGAVVETVDFRTTPQGVELSLPQADGPSRPLTLRLVPEGGGRPHWRAVLRGFTPEVRARHDAEFRVWTSQLLAAAPRYRGKAVPTGFGVLANVGEREHWDNEVHEAAQGELFDAQVSFSYVYPTHSQADPGDYFTLEVPLPAGTRVLDGSVQGGFQAYEVQPGRVVASYAQTKHSGYLRMTLIASEPGDYRVLPAVLRNSLDPSRVAVGEPLALKVLGADERSSDVYRPTPDELFHLGAAMYDHQDYVGARERLTALYDGFADGLRPERLREAAERLLFLGIRAGDAAATVKYFEVLKEKNPALFVPFEDVLAVGRAYRELGEHERALLIFKAILDETFGKDLKVAGTLEEQGEFAGAVDTLERLWLEYPDSPAVIETYLSLADKLLAKAPAADKDKSLRDAGRDRFALSLQGILALQRFLAFYPTSPLAPDAGLNLVSAYLGLESYEDVARLGGEMAGTYVAPRYRDAFTYSRAVAEWHLGHDEAAQGLLREIAASSYVDERGVEHHSLNRELAYYILAQIFHARREFADAAEYYEKVKDEFVDAVEVLQAFRERGIALPEVTTTRLGEPTLLELEHKNLERAELLVYRVDLMTLYLRERNLSHVTEVNLAGISPTLRREVELGAARDLEQTKTEVRLELERPGAYLVLCRGAELHASGLVLVSDVELEVREDAGAGRLRVTALDAKTRSFLKGVDVRVVGSQSAAFERGETDPRGLFVADGLAGTATVIARLGEQYAFYRGALALGGPRQQQAEADVRFSAQLDDQGYFKNVIEFNDGNRRDRNEKLEKEINRSRKGVQVQQVK